MSVPREALRAQPPALADGILRLHGLTSILAEARSAAEATRLAASATRDAVSGSMAFVWLVGENGDFELAANAGYDGPTLDRFRTVDREAKLPICDAVRTGQPIFLTSPAERAARYPLVGDGRADGQGAWAAVPLRSHGRSIGVMSVSWPAPRQFSDDEVTFLLIVAQQCANALERAALTEAREAALARAEANEAGLRASEQRLRTILDSAGSVIFLKDLAGRHLIANEQYVRESGIPMEQIVGHTDEEFLGPELAREFREQDELVLEAGHPMEFEHVVEHGGQRFVFSSIKFPVHDASGHIYAVGGIATNITARKRAEEQLREESRINETLYRIGASFAGELDPGRLMQLITDEATQLCGARFGSFFFNVDDGKGGAYQLSTISGADKDRFHGMRLPRATPMFAPTFRGEGVVRLDDVRSDPRFGNWGAQPAGHPAIASYLAIPVKSRGGVVLGGLFFGHPEPRRFTAQHERIISGIAAHAAIALESARLYKTVHEQKELLAQAVQRAEEADRRKDEFLAMLGHELRNPLAPMVTALHLMRLKGTGGERERDVIERQVRHLSRLVDDLLDVSRITRGKIELRRERFETAAAIAKAVEMVSPLLEKYVHHLEIDVPREGLTVEADPVRLAQVFQNLLTNAAKYSEPGSHIAVIAARDGGDVVVTVRDDGMGIAPSLLPRIFEPFVQGDRTIDRAEGGLGLGLTLVERLVSLHGGTVAARSEGPGRGSEFEVRLPLAANADNPDAQAQRVARAAPRRRVLVVDDNADAALTLAEMLRVLGSDARVALDGIQALQEAEQFAPDLALVDIGLPVMDGYELCGRLREKLGARVELVAVTGYGQDGDRERSRAAGFSRHLVKPIDLDVLQELLAGEVPRP